MVKYEKIIKECFWDSNLTVDDLKDIVKKNDTREMQKLFSKIIYNSTDKLQSLQLFSHEQLVKFFLDFEVTYNKKYITKHLLVLKSLLLGEKHHIEGLQWQKR